MTLIALLAVVCAALVVLGFVAPRLSRRAQDKLDRNIDRADEGARHHGGIAGKLGDRSARTSRKAVDKATESGRSARRRVD